MWQCTFLCPVIRIMFFDQFLFFQQNVFLAVLYSFPTLCNYMQNATRYPLDRIVPLHWIGFLLCEGFFSEYARPLSSVWLFIFVTFGDSMSSSLSMGFWEQMILINSVQTEGMCLSRLSAAAILKSLDWQILLWRYFASTLTHSLFTSYNNPPPPLLMWKGPWIGGSSETRTGSVFGSGYLRNILLKTFLLPLT